MDMLLKNEKGKPILMNMVKAIRDHKEYLGTVDGLIGDGDHGVNMNKGFSMFEARFGGEEFAFSQGLEELGSILYDEIGGSMGPIYGTIFGDMAEYLDEKGRDGISLVCFTNALAAGLEGLYDIVEARRGDKTLIDTLAPAVASLETDAENDTDFILALEHMKSAAEEGKNTTRDLVAKYGRSSRLGGRSIGFLDAGACSCCIILQAMADAMIQILKTE